MPDLLTQLSDYARQLDDETPPLHAFATPVARSPRRATTRPWVVLVGAAVAVLLLIGVPLLITSTWFAAPPVQEPPVTTVAPSTTATTVPDAGFEYPTDSLCDWFTAEDMNQIIAAAQERVGTGWPLVAFEAEDCARLAPPVGARWDWNHTEPKPGSQNAVPGLAVSLMPVAWLGEEPVADFVGHEMLDESVTYGNLHYHCGFLDLMSVELRVEGHEDDVLSFSMFLYHPYASCEGVLTYQFGLAVADSMLRDMGWVDGARQH